MKMSGPLMKIVVLIAGIFGLPAIFYIFGGSMVSMGSALSNNALVNNGWGFILFGTLILALIILYKRHG